MAPDTPAFARWTVLLAVLTGGAVAVLMYLAVPGPSPPGGWTNSAAGPVGPDDRAMLVAVRQAALWETPVGQQAQQMATEADVRSTAGRIAADMGGLSEQVQAVAQRLGVQLPSQSTSQQQLWTAQISGDSGAGYDRAMVSHLRATCQDTLQAIDRARSDTRNPDVRTFADHAAQIVREHLHYLDNTGLVTAR